MRTALVLSSIAPLNLSSPQTQTPLLDALSACAQQPDAPFYTPGHRRGQGAPVALRQLLGAHSLQADLPELPGLDNLFTPSGVIQQAQALAADAFGAEQTWFLANGSTCGIEAVVLATCQPGDRLILSRNVHRSAIAALILSGAQPIFVEPLEDPAWDVAPCVSPDRLSTTLAQYPDAKAVLIVSPTYQGVCGDLRAIATLVHQYNIPLLVDEAHGAHFSFHPDLPTAALQAGADGVVQSTHKTLSALTQAAMLHVQGPRIDRERLNRSVALLQSTSPSYLLLASLDAARWQMAIEGRSHLDRTLALAARIRQALHGLPLLRLRQAPSEPSTSQSSGFYQLDQTRLTVDVGKCGMTGFSADETIAHQFRVIAELPTLRQLTFILTAGNTEADGDRLVEALQYLATHPQDDPIPEVPALPPLAPIALAPRDAFFAPHQSVPSGQAIDQICAELVCPYPPGIPILVPGERITPAAIDYLQQVQRAGGLITGCADPTLQQIRIVPS